MASKKRPTNPKPGETYTGPKGATWRWSAKQDKWIRVQETSWEDRARELYPAFSYLIDNPEVMGPEITDMIRKAVKEKWYKNPDNGFAKMESAIRNTNYYKTTAASARQFDQLAPADQQARIDAAGVDIRNFLGTTAIKESDLNTIVRDAARLNLQGQVLQNYVYSQSLVRDTEGQYRLGETAGMILAGGRASQLRQKAREYFTNVTDAEVEQYLTGQKTDEDFNNLFKARAKAQMPHLSGQIDQNLTLEQIAADYKALASSLLEKNETDIDMTEPRFMEAMSYTDPNGNTRQMNRAEWARKLKTDRQYGWQYTQSAVNQARSIARSMVRGFGGRVG